MDDRLIAQVNATAKALRDAAKSAEQELRDAEKERTAIEDRIGQLKALRDQLYAAVDDAERVASGGRSGARRTTAKKKSSRKKASRKKAARKKASRKKASVKKSTSKQTAGGEGPRRATPVPPPAQVS